MDGPVISFDVSKGSSHMQGFIGHGEPLGKPVAIRHDSEGFAKIDAMRARLREEAGSDPAAVFEHTGVYGNTLESYLRSAGLRSYAISPLESAKVRKSMIRPTKNDSLDCGTIAEVYYIRKVREARRDGAPYARLREMGRHYHYLLGVKVTEKCRYNRCLDDVWPGFCDALDPSSPKSLAIVAHYGHPSRIRSKEQMVRFLTKLPRRGSVSTGELAERVYSYARSHVSGADPGSYRADEAAAMAKRVAAAIGECDGLMDSMVSLAKTLPEFELLRTIPGIGDVTAARLIAEIGDIGAYPKADSLVAYAGLDPAVMQSGQSDGKHMHITKKGNPHLRAALYVAVANMVICKADNLVTRFVLRKKNDGLHYKAAVTAGCSKLLRLIHAMLRVGTCYSENNRN